MTDDEIFEELKAAIKRARNGWDAFGVVDLDGHITREVTRLFEVEPKTDETETLTAGDIYANRKALGLSVREMATLCGVNSRKWLRWENEAFPAPRTISIVLRWLRGGFRPPEWPQRTAKGDGAASNRKDGSS